MRTMTRGGVILLGVAGWAAGVLAGEPAAPLVLTEQGQSPYVVTLAEDALPADRYAAAEFTNLIRRITGVGLPIEAPGAAGDQPRIAIGPGAAVAAGLDPAALEDLGDDGILLRTVGRTLFLTGGRGAARGTLYAVYTFLEDVAGCRWWTPTAAAIPPTDRLIVPALDRRYRPVLESREPFYVDAWDGDWAARNKVNGSSARLTTKHGGQIVLKGVHTFYQLIPPEKYFQDHPEWFSQSFGRRTHRRAQLCLTNPELLACMIERVKEWLRQGPATMIVSVSQNDWGGACACARCRAVDRAEGSPSGSLLRFVNAVAEAIEPEFPRAAIETLAYHYTQAPPKVTRPRPNVVIRLCSIECDFARPLSDPSNRVFQRDIEAWARICERLYVWDYVTDFHHYVQPHPNWFLLGDNVRFFATHNVKGVLEQGNYSSPGGEMAELRSWVLAKLLWDPALDTTALIETFAHGYYGPAAPAVLEYLRGMRRSLEQSGERLTLYTAPDARFLSPEALLTAWSHFRDAEAAVANDPELLRRVRLAQLPVLYVLLLRWEEMRDGAKRLERPWPLSDDPALAFARFVEIYRANHMRALAEWPTWSLDAFRKKMGLPEEKSAVKPSLTPISERPAPRGGYSGTDGGDEDFCVATPLCRRVRSGIRKEPDAPAERGGYKRAEGVSVATPL